MTVDPFALEDVWIAAVNALPDPRPVAALLRSDTPLPSGARHLIAELFHPGDPPLTDWTVVPKTNPAFDRMIRQFSVTVAYRKALADGTPARKAADETGKKAGVTARQAFRWIQENTPERLLWRLREPRNESADILASSNVSNISGDDVISDELASVVQGVMSTPG